MGTIVWTLPSVESFLQEVERELDPRRGFPTDQQVGDREVAATCLVNHEPITPDSGAEDQLMEAMVAAAERMRSSVEELPDGVVPRGGVLEGVLGEVGALLDGDVCQLILFDDHPDYLSD